MACTYIILSYVFIFIIAINFVGSLSSCLTLTCALFTSTTLPPPLCFLGGFSGGFPGGFSGGADFDADADFAPEFAPGAEFLRASLML